MSLLIEALQRAESGAPRTAPPAPAAVPEPATEAQRQSARTLLEASEAPRQMARGRIVRLAAYGSVGALLAAGSAWWWLTVPSTAQHAPPVVQAPAEHEASAPAQQPPPPPTVAAAVAAPRRAPVAAAPQRAATPPVATEAAAPPSPAPVAPLVRKGETLQPPLAAAYAALQAGQFEAAERWYRETLEIDARQPDALIGLAVVAERRGARAEAIALYRRALAVEPDQPVALAALAELSAAGDGAVQESVLRQALARRPASAALHAALGRLLAAQDRWSEAQPSFAAAWQLEPASAERAYDLAVALDRLRRTEAAAAMYARALAQAGGAPAFDAQAAQDRLQRLQAHLQAAR